MSEEARARVRAVFGKVRAGAGPWSLDALRSLDELERDVIAALDGPEYEQSIEVRWDAPDAFMGGGEDDGDG